MKRYHEEKNILENRTKLRRHLLWSLSGKWPEVEAGRFRKSLRCAGCTRARCQVCHPEKYPKRQLTIKEQKSNYDFKEYKTT